MGKADDMRRQREARFAQQQRASAPADSGRPAPAASSAAGGGVQEPDAADDADDAADAVVAGGSPRARAAVTAKGAAAEQGACSVCGKQRPLQRGLVATHQKGLGKVCAGSRKAPA
jgi:hypothetical protein